MKKSVLLALIGLFIVRISNGQTFTINKKGVFVPENKKVLLFVNQQNKNLILFKSNLNVNTDGTPLSYHPDDLRGKTLAMNNICNAVAVRKDGSKENLCMSHFSEAISVFAKYRDSNYETIPIGYKINWSNVLISEKISGKTKPCIIKEGEYKGYFASGTALKNDVSGSDCDVENQVNALKVPGLVLVGGADNILKQYGARLGDLVIAYNAVNQKIVYAVINDIGPKDRLGEGSVLLNKLLLDKPDFPKNRAETFSFITKNTIVSIIPASKDFEIAKPYTLENIQSRALKWLNEQGFTDEQAFKNFLNSNLNQL